MCSSWGLCRFRRCSRCLANISADRAEGRSHISGNRGIVGGSRIGNGLRDARGNRVTPNAARAIGGNASVTLLCACKPRRNA